MFNQTAKSFMKIVNWNINSIRMRISHLLEMLSKDGPDLVLLQETKCQDESFPELEINDLGYNICKYGQKTFNGVAILSKYKIEEVNNILPVQNDGEIDNQARYLEVVISEGGRIFRVISVYVPNGNEVGSEKYIYKLNFYKRLNAHLQSLLTEDEHLIVAGDFNVANLEIDVFDPKSFAGKICFEINERKAFRELLSLGLIDVQRFLNPDAKSFTWWDYRAGAFNYDKGLKIDYFLLNPRAMDLVKEYKTLREYRALEKPSDHAPIMLELTV